MNNIHHICKEITRLNRLIDEAISSSTEDQGYIQALCQRLNSEMDALFLEENHG
jgi:hypothetical protein